MVNFSQPTILVIIGITGDLARRKLLPAIAEIARAGSLPNDFTVVGISRRQVSNAEVVIGTPGLSDSDRSFFAKHLQMYTMDIADPEAYRQFDDHLQALQPKSSKKAQILFYVSVPPQVSRPIIAALGQAGFGKRPDVKLLLEKPFGSDFVSAQALIAETRQHFDESQLYRIDHYLAKEMAQNILVFRSQNTLFRQTWNSQFIEKIEIVASEQIGIEGRAAFYEQTGALRDVVQNHLLQLAALTLMELPTSDSVDIPELRLAALQALQPPHEDQLSYVAHRGQYRSYAPEVGNTGTQTETFAAVTLYSNAPQWQGVPIHLVTGKALDKKETVIRVHYKAENDSEANELTLKIQPEESIEMIMWAKKPGYHSELERLPFHFTYQDHYQSLPEAYERVLVDAINSNHNLFASSQEVLAAWKLLAPIQHYWSMHADDLIIYEQGSSPQDILEKL
jgi:glucose-6-phosphate 1-dehydrogenase